MGRRKSLRMNGSDSSRPVEAMTSARLRRGGSQGAAKKIKEARDLGRAMVDPSSLTKRERRKAEKRARGAGQHKPRYVS